VGLVSLVLAGALQPWSARKQAVRYLSCVTSRSASGLTITRAPVAASQRAWRSASSWSSPSTAGSSTSIRRLAIRSSIWAS
jgi:hypothetical protein